MNKRVINLVLMLALLMSFAAVIPAAAQDDTETIVVGINAEYPPFESVDADNEFVGFDIVLMNALAADAGFEVEYVNTKWDGIFVALQQGEFDAVISAATITEEREEIVDFTDPYFNAGQAIAVSAALAETVAGVDDLVGLRVGVQLGTTGDEYATAVDGIEVVRFDEITLAFQALGAGEIDAILSDGPTSADIIANNPDLEAVMVGEPLTDEFYGIAVNPEKPEVLNALNTSLANVIESGEYGEIFMEWFGQEAPAMFLPAEATAIEVDFTDPESVVLGMLATLLSPDVTLEALSAFICEEPGESMLVPQAEADLTTFQSVVLEDASQLTFEVTVDGETATVVPGGTLVLSIGEFDAATLLTPMGITDITLTQDADGNWKVCPPAAE